MSMICEEYECECVRVWGVSMICEECECECVRGVGCEHDM